MTYDYRLSFSFRLHCQAAINVARWEVVVAQAMNHEPTSAVLAHDDTAIKIAAGTQQKEGAALDTSTTSSRSKNSNLPNLDTNSDERSSTIDASTTIHTALRDVPSLDSSDVSSNNQYESAPDFVALLKRDGYDKEYPSDVRRTDSPLCQQSSRRCVFAQNGARTIPWLF